MNKVRLALIGAGVIGKRHLLAMLQVPEVELAAIVDVSDEAISVATEQGVPHYPDTQAALTALNLDGVIVATPTEQHFEPTKYALENGVHVLVEKPIMASLEEAQEIIGLSETTGNHVLVGHQRRYYHLVNRAREIIRGGMLGQLVAVSGQWNMRKHESYYDADWRKRWQAGPILTNLVHDMDLLRFLIGEVVSLSAEVSNAVKGFEKEDTAAINIRFENGALGSFVLSDQTHSPWGWESATGENLAFPRTGENAIRFMGTEAALEFPNLKLWNSATGEPEWRNDLQAIELPRELGDPYVNQLRHFAEVIRGSALPCVDARDATDTLRCILAVYESAKSGKRVYF